LVKDYLNCSEKVYIGMFTAFYRLISFLSYIFPIRLACFITKIVTAGVYFIFYQEARRNIEINLSYVFSNGLEKWEKEKLIFKTIQNFALFIYEFVIIRKINQKTFKRFLNPVGFEKVEEALKMGKGVIFLTGHLGNWEYGASVLTYLGYTPLVIARRFKNDFVTKFYFNRRRKQGMEVAYLNEAVRMSLLKLGENGLVAIVGDRDYTNQGKEITLFGKNTMFPTGALLLGLKTGAPLFPTFAVRVGDCKYDVFFDTPIVLKSKGNKEEEIRKGLAKWIKILESYVRRYPSQWYRFKPFWELEKE